MPRLKSIKISKSNDLHNFSLIRYCVAVFLKHKIAVVIVAFCSIALSIATSNIPSIIGDATDEGGFFSRPILLLSICYLIRAICKLARNHFSALLRNSVVTGMRMYCIDKYFVGNYNSSVNLYSLITNDVECIAGIISQQTLVFIEDVLVFIIALLYIVRENPIVAIILIVESLLIIVISISYSSTVSKLTRSHREKIDDLNKVIHESVIVQKLIRALNMYRIYVGKFETCNQNNAQTEFELSRKKRVFTIELESLLSIAIIICLLVVAINENATVSTVITYYSYMLLFFSTSRSFSGVINLYINSKQSVLRIKQAFSNGNDTIHLKRSSKNDTITCTRVGRDDIVFKKGELTCIKGKNGSGKSQIIESIAGNAIDGFVVNLPEDATIGISQQTCIFLDNTIEYNISLGRSASCQWKNEIYEKLFIDEIVKMHGDTILNGDDVLLSGGEQQRICLARALFSDPDILLIDDSITAIDIIRRQKIVQYINTVKHDRFIIIVSNYPDVFEIADKVIEV